MKDETYKALTDIDQDVNKAMGRLGLRFLSSIVGMIFLAGFGHLSWQVWVLAILLLVASTAAAAIGTAQSGAEILKLLIRTVEELE